MKNEKSNDELARELRVRLIREVAVPGSRITILGQQTSGLHNKISNPDESRKTFLQALLTECGACIEDGTLASTSKAIEKKYKQYIINTGLENEKAKDELEKLRSKKAVLETTAEGVLAEISRDVLAEMYGRGELILTPKGLQRIIGRIACLKESTDPVYGIILGESDKHKATITEIAWLCENSDQHPPLFFVDIKLMPLDEEELSRICWENDDYELLVKNIPEDQIVWPSGSVFQLNKRSSRESYLISQGNERMGVVRIERLTYPHRKVEILGSVVRNKENLKALRGWGGYNEVPVELEDASRDYNSLLSTIEWHLFRKYPGVIFEMPQWEGERFPIS